jgi:hypothetical protein
MCVSCGDDDRFRWDRQSFFRPPGADTPSYLCGQATWNRKEIAGHEHEWRPRGVGEKECSRVKTSPVSACHRTRRSVPSGGIAGRWSDIDSGYTSDVMSWSPTCLSDFVGGDGDSLTAGCELTGEQSGASSGRHQSCDDSNDLHRRRRTRGQSRSSLCHKSINGRSFQEISLRIDGSAFYRTFPRPTYRFQRRVGC